MYSIPHQVITRIDRKIVLYCKGAGMLHFEFCCSITLFDTYVHSIYIFYMCMSRKHMHLYNNSRLQWNRQISGEKTLLGL